MLIKFERSPQVARVVLGGAAPSAPLMQIFTFSGCSKTTKRNRAGPGAAGLPLTGSYSSFRTPTVYSLHHVFVTVFVPGLVELPNLHRSCIPFLSQGKPTSF